MQTRSMLKHDDQQNQQSKQNNDSQVKIIKSSDQLQTKYKNKFDNRQLTLNNGMYGKLLNQQQKVNIFKPTLKSQSISIVYLNSNQYNKMIKQLAQIDVKLYTMSNVYLQQYSIFSQIKQLKLHENNINNIQSIDKINLTSLETLHLQTNHITKLKPLAKCNFKHISLISFGNNKIKQDSFYCLNKVKGGKLKTINFNNWIDPKVINNLNYVLTLQTIHLDHLQVKSESQILNKIINQQVKFKYPRIDLIINDR